ncbi:hypothetical protein K8Q93_03770 [Candidatus Parcubacteria bacterium]|nr:hypothetical protein [Candidatus Parcubacteria bacterium]
MSYLQPIDNGPQSPEIDYNSLSPNGEEGGVILPASGDSYFEAAYQSYYQSQYQSTYEAYYQSQYQSTYEGYYQSQYQSTYEAYYQSQYQSTYESYYQPYYEGYYQAGYEAAYQSYYQSYYQSAYQAAYQGYYQGYYQASYCSANQGQVCTSAANSCGAVTYGTYSCAGACSATVAPAESSCVVPVITVAPPSPTIVINRGDACSFSWSSANATSCVVTGPGVNSTGLSGSVSVPDITQSRSYQVRCYNGSMVNTTKTVNCQVNPTFEEI